MTKGILLPRDNARSHCSSDPSFICLDRAPFDLEVLDPLPPVKSLHQVISDFYIFYYFGSKHYNNDKGVKMAMTSSFSKKAVSFYKQGIQNLVLRYDKFLNKLSNDVEQQRKYVKCKKNFVHENFPIYFQMALSEKKTPSKKGSRKHTFL